MLPFLNLRHDTALIGTLFTWGMTALGAGLVFFFRRINKIVLNAMLGFASGVMIAASFWSLLQPAIVMAEEIGQIPYLVAALGFLAGGGFLMLVDHLLPHMYHSARAGRYMDRRQPKEHPSVLLSRSTIFRRTLLSALRLSCCCRYRRGLTGAIALAVGIVFRTFPKVLLCRSRWA